MNYALFAEFVRNIENDLVQRFDVPAAEAKKIATRLELDSMQAGTKARQDNQLVLDYREHGPVVLAERMGVCRETIRRRFEDVVNKKSPQEIAA